MAKPRVFEAKYQRKPWRFHGEVWGFEHVFECDLSHQHLAVIKDGQVIVDELPCVKSLQKMGVYGRPFPEPKSRQKKGDMCISDGPLPSASEIRSSCETSMLVEETRENDEGRTKRKRMGETEEELDLPMDTEYVNERDEDAGTSKQVEPVVLKLSNEEALYLLHESGCIRILDDPESKNQISAEEFYKTCCRRGDGIKFIRHYIAYRYYRRKGWIVKDGELFGVHFVLYQDRPACCHSTFGVWVTTPDKKFSWQQIAALCRELKLVSKDLIICHVSFNPAHDNELPNLADLDQCQVMEMHVSPWFARHEYDQSANNESADSTLG